jgi:AcrR family transcriptional regulator
MNNLNDRCVNKTKRAIFVALEQLLMQKSYYKISVGDIIGMANVGRSTFYNHFETKDIMFEEYLKLIFNELKLHSSLDVENHANIPVVELLNHIAENKKIIQKLVSGDTSEIIFNKFKDYWNQSAEEFINTIIPPEMKTTVPRDLLINYLTSSLIDMIKWWLTNDMPYSANQMEDYWIALVKPTLFSQLMSK